MEENKNKSKKVLKWEEAAKHILALDEIEEKHLPSEYAHKFSKNQKKKLEAKIHNEKQEYLNFHKITPFMGTFLRTGETNE